MIFNLSDKYNSILNYITLSDNLNDLYRSNKNINIYFDSKGETNEFIENLCNENIYIDKDEVELNSLLDFYMNNIEFLK